jgi:hypothetical protein
MSLRHIRPSVYDVPLGINFNESFRLSLVAGLSESVELYKSWFDTVREVMSRFCFDSRDSKQMPYLGDQYSALISVHQNMRHFLCIRHLIEKFRPGSLLGILAKRLVLGSIEHAFRLHTDKRVHDVRALVAMRELRFEDRLVLLYAFGLAMRS